MSKLAVVGSVNMDMVLEVARLPRIGETVAGENYAEHFGGKGANQAVAAARMESDVYMIGCVGDDPFGHRMVQNLREQGVHTEGIRISRETGSGKAVILVSGGDNAIILDGGANMVLSPEDIRAHADLLDNCAYLLLQLEIPMETVLEAAKIAHKKEIPVILNPAPAKELPDELWRYIDLLIPNETEAAFYVGHPVSTEEEAKDAVLALRKRGVRHVIITMGAEGAVYNIGDELYHQVSRKVEAVDSTAAGDSFIGSLATALGNGADLKEAVRIGTIVGSVVVTRRGAQDSIPARADILSYF